MTPTLSLAWRTLALWALIGLALPLLVPCFLFGAGRALVKAAVHSGKRR
jgi:hypothetical protein